MVYRTMKKNSKVRYIGVIVRLDMELFSLEPCDINDISCTLNVFNSIS